MKIPVLGVNNPSIYSKVLTVAEMVSFVGWIYHLFSGNFSYFLILLLVWAALGIPLGQCIMADVEKEKNEQGPTREGTE